MIKPRNIPHTYWNATKTPAKLIGIYAPGGFEHYHEALPQAFGPNGPDFAKLTRLREQYGVVDVLEWIPELIAQYNVRLLGQ